MTYSNSYDTKKDLQKLANDENELKNKYKNKTDDELHRMFVKGEIFRTHNEEFSQGHYTGTRYYFWANKIGDTNTDLIRVTFNFSLFN